MSEPGMDAELHLALEAVRQRGLYRRLRRVDSPQSTRVSVDSRLLLNLSSNDYLGLANDPRIKAAAAQAVSDFGAGSGASRLICGSLAIHHELDESLAAFKGTEAALSFSSGYATALGVIPALVERDDLVIIDELVHASIVDAARLSRAKLRVFAHNDLNDLEGILRWADQRRQLSAGASGARKPRILVVTESVFSMDGDVAPLTPIVELAERAGAWLMVDEAHATGLFGPNRRGVADQLGLGDRIQVQMGTLGKALGASGGFICGSRTLIDFLVNSARTFIFSTAPSPGAAGAATAAIRLVRGEAGRERCDLLWCRVKDLGDALGRAGCISPAATPPSAIQPVMIGDEREAVEVSSRLQEQGFLVPAIRYPTVARGAARLRMTVTACHTSQEIVQLGDALRDILGAC